MPWKALLPACALLALAPLLAGCLGPMDGVHTGPLELRVERAGDGTGATEAPGVVLMIDREERGENAVVLVKDADVARVDLTLTVDAVKAGPPAADDTHCANATAGDGCVEVIGPAEQVVLHAVVQAGGEVLAERNVPAGPPGSDPTTTTFTVDVQGRERVTVTFDTPEGGRAEVRVQAREAAA